MIKYFSVALFCSGILFAAEKKKDMTEQRAAAAELLTAFRSLEAPAFGGRKLESLRHFLTMIKNWKPDESDKDKLSWQQKKAIGDEKDVRVLFGLSHPKSGDIEQRPSDKQEWVSDQFHVLSNGKDCLVQDVLYLSTDPATRGNVVGRHIHMHGLIDGRGIYTISAKPDSKRINWHYTNGVGI